MELILASLPQPAAQGNRNLEEYASCQPPTKLLCSVGRGGCFRVDRTDRAVAWLVPWTGTHFAYQRTLFRTVLHVLQRASIAPDAGVCPRLYVRRRTNTLVWVVLYPFTGHIQFVNLVAFIMKRYGPSSNKICLPSRDFL